jgi:phenylalanyl-tRNA synthetase beta chain
VKIVYPWLCELVRVPADPETAAREISLRGFEVADVELGHLPVIDFEITANRPDCLSHVGIAREASAIWGLPLMWPELLSTQGMPASAAGGVDVRLEDSALCPRYCAQVFDVRVGRSPDWLADRLAAAGVRPINNVVDVTNYVMLEFGQPMHAFDLDRVGGRTLVIRRARPGERLRTLDGVERELDPEMLVIADAECASALGGVMGGHDSEIGESTRLIALESAFFHPPSVRRTSKRLGLKTEASIRFERGADVNAPPIGIARAAALFQRIGAGTPVGGLVDRYPSPRRPLEIQLRAARARTLLGLDVPPADIERILTPLGFEAAATGGGTWTVTVPSFRVDVAREVDLIEEIGRHYGFDRLPPTFPALTTPQAPPDPVIARDRLVRRLLTASGFSEAMTFAFIEAQAARPFCEPGAEPSAIANPLSEKFAVLRPSLLPGLIDACAHNRRRERKDVRLFETGSRFPAGGEDRAVAIVWCGAAQGAHWSASPPGVDFFDVKGVAQRLCDAVGIEVEWTPATRPYLVTGRAAEARLTQNGAERVVAVVGQISPPVAEARGFPAAEAIFAAELDLEVLAGLAGGENLRAEPLPRFPAIVRDVSILVDEALPAATVRGTIRSAAPATLESIVEFDRYQGKGIPEGRISLSLRLTFRAPDRTLTDDDADAATNGIVEALRRAHRAERR